MKSTLLFLLMAALFCVAACEDGGIPDESTAVITESGSQAPTDTESDTETSDGSESEYVTETETETEAPPPEVPAPSILSLLKNASLPVGRTMYVWGGGWNEADDGAGEDAVTIGISERWAEFAALQSSDYDYKQTKYQIRDGLDCSGYVGWAVYNTLETENGKEGYVTSSTKMAEEYALLGLGTFTAAEDVADHKAGDVMSRNGHVWIVVGTCADGSVLMLHSSPPGVMFSGTRLPGGGDSEASLLAERIMAERYPEWYARFPKCSRSNKYLEDSSAMRWHRHVLADEEGLSEMTAEEIVALIFDEK